MDALILCGGFATRLEPITLFIPKPLLPIGGRPLLDNIIEDISKFNIDRIVLSTNKKFADQFEYWIKHTKAMGVKISIELIVEPALDNDEKFGAIRGIRYAIEKARLNDDLLIIAGDNFYTFSLERLFEHFNKSKKPTICVYDVESAEKAKKFGVVKVEGGIVKYFVEKPEAPESTLISTVIYTFPRESLKKFGEYLDAKQNPDAPGYFLQWYIKNEEVHAVVYSGEWFDIGNIDTYQEVFNKFHRELSNGN